VKTRSLGALALAASLLAPSAVLAQDWPNKPVRIMYPATAGGPGDIMARAASEKLQARFKQPFIVENRPGGASFVAATAVHQAPADGYTVYYGAASALTRTFHANPPFEFFRDFKPMGGLFVTSYVFVANTQVPAATIRGVIDYAKKNPGKLNYGAETATSTLALGLLNATAGTDIVLVPYKGNAQSVQALITNEVQIGFGPAQVYEQHVKAGKLMYLAATYDRRIATLPDVPTTAEAGLAKVKLYTVAAFWARSETPKEAQDKMIAALKDIAPQPDIVARYASAGGTPLVADAAEIRKLAMEEAENYAAAAKAAKFQPPMQ
jgi:tripartite-type tricarboxylate transporter receptor subunit TctC